MVDFFHWKLVFGWGGRFARSTWAASLRLFRRLVQRGWGHSILGGPNRARGDFRTENIHQGQVKFFQSVDLPRDFAHKSGGDSDEQQLVGSKFSPWRPGKLRNQQFQSFQQASQQVCVDYQEFMSRSWYISVFWTHGWLDDLPAWVRWLYDIIWLDTDYGIWPDCGDLPISSYWC